ncbi:MAG TPA: GAF domain-containing sensor histidine kinase [Acidimicrobiales bacterium]
MTEVDSDPGAGSPSWRDRVLRLADATDGSTHDDGIGLVHRVDRIAAFAPAILAVRWAIAITSIALATQQFDEKPYSVAVWSAIVLVYTVSRTLAPLRYTGDVRSLLEVIGEVILNVSCVVATGFWDSPFILMMLTAVTVAGFARGYAFALRISLVSTLAVSLPYLLQDPSRERIVQSAQWTLVLLLVALIAGYTRQISGEADRQHTLALDRLGRLADANELLYSLHRVTQTLPASLDLDDVLETTVTRLRGLFDFDTAVILGFDDTDGGWELLKRDGGGRVPLRQSFDQLTVPLRRVIHEEGVLSVSNLAAAGWSGLGPRSGSGMYAVLPARGSVIGLLALEHTEDSHFSDRDVELLRGFVEPVGLAIDNARWFSRLRTVGADEERTRIARDLHDRIGQSLAYMAFELDNIVSKQGKGEEIGPSLHQLRDDVRGVIREVRDTLYDLRTDVSDAHDIADTLDAYVARIHERSSLRVELFCDRDARLPLLQEREMWRIAQEALTNVERHSRASHARVLWRCNGDSAALEVTDNGVGFPDGKAGRLDSYGIMGMRERASSIGATLEVTSKPDEGTRVRCSLVRSEAEQSDPNPSAAIR